MADEASMNKCAVCKAEIAASEHLCSFCRYHPLSAELLSKPPQ